MKPFRKTITVYGASSSKIDKSFADAAYRLGRLMALSGRTVLTGGGNTGLMASVEDGVLDNGGTVIGVIPKFMVENGWMHGGLSKVIETDDMHERKQKLADMADAIVTLPGGTGTMEELLEVITWKTLGLCSKPLIILNTDGYYDKLLDFFDNAVKLNFMKEEYKSVWRVVNTPEEAMEIIDEEDRTCPVGKYNN